MKFKTGLAVGFAAGFWAATQTSDQTRAQIDDLVGRMAGNPRVQRVTETVARDARRLGDAVEHRVRDATHRTTETAVDEVEPSSTSTSSGATASRTARTA